MPLPPNTLLQDRYRIDALLGQGGMGAVYKAWDVRLKIACAVKENVASQRHQNLAQALAQQFEREATILAALHHPNLPRVTNYFLHNDDQYLVMDFVDGEDLATRLGRIGPLPERDVLGWIMQVCDALTYLHTRPSAPIIHRDIKPANIKITPDGRLMVVDFGLSKLYDPNLSTVAGAKGWSRGYSPPEQYDRRTDTRSDQYALAATTYTLLTDTLPPDALERQMGYVNLRPPREIVPMVSVRVENAILRAMSISQDDRFVSIEGFRAALGGNSAYVPPSPNDPSPTLAPTEVTLTAALVSPAGRNYSLRQSQNLIGRRSRRTGEAPDIDLSDEVDGDTVSRKHAWLKWAGGKWHLQPHTEHKNIVKVNGRLVPEAGVEIQINDQIQVGAVLLTFLAK